MKRVIVKSLYDAFEYVMEHFYLLGKEETAVRKDTYAVISMQDSYTGGIGFQFTKTDFCKGVLTLLVDDKQTETGSTLLFSEENAHQIIEFIEDYLYVDTLLVHCYGGQSRSAAVGAFAVKMLGGDNSEAFSKRTPNMHIYKTLENVWEERIKLNEEEKKFGMSNESVTLDLIRGNKPDFTRLCELSRLLSGNEGFENWEGITNGQKS